MQPSINEAIFEVQESLKSGAITKDEAKQRLEGVITLVKILTAGQPFAESVIKTTLAAAKEVIKNA